MRKRLAFVVAFLLAWGSAWAVDHPTLERQVMVGYQGWFRTPGDGAGMGWAHYAESGTGQFGPGHLGIDFWPDVSELSSAEKYPAPFAEADGSSAQVFSSHNPQTVARHFRWMRDYGIDGAFVQRFPSAFVRGDERSRLRRKAADDVLGYARAGAEQSGRSFAVMYDLSGLRSGEIVRVMQDWRHLVDDLKVRASPAYQGHRGKPVVAVWGVGFNDGRAYTLEEAEALIDFLKKDPVYGGNTVMLGIPTWWREGTADAVADPRLPLVLQKADILSPWTPGRYYDLGGIRAHAERFWKPDRAWCAAHGLDYMPVVFPGFSWRNLKRAGGGIGRDDGRFLWEQYRQVVNGGFTLVYQAMFDEMDEGTQIFKVTDRPPPDAGVGTYRPLPSDYYLRLTGAAGEYLHRGRPMPERIVPPSGHPEIARYLAGGNEAAYAEAGPSYEAQRSFFEIADALTAHPAAWAPVGSDGRRIRVSGEWGPRFFSTGNAEAAVSWELPVPAEGDYLVRIRHPGDPNQDHATAARLRVAQGGAAIAETTVNLRQGGLEWTDAARVRLSAGAACEVTLDRAAGSGGLTLFEARLIAAAGAPGGIRIALVSDTHTTRGKNEDQAFYHGHFDEAIAAVNAAGVDFVLIAGDLTQNGKPEEIGDFKAQAKALRAPVFWIPGNHDIGGKWMPGPPIGTTAARVAAYERNLGPSFYVRECAGIRIIGINSSVLGSGLPAEAAQWAFLERELARPAAMPTLAFMHYPPFVAAPDEPGGAYWDIEPRPRARLLALLHQGGVRLVLTGHLHRPLINRSGGILFVTTLPVSFGLPRGKQPEGWTLVTLPPHGEPQVEFRTIAH